MKVLVTGFKPFNNLNLNYSKEILRYIKDVDTQILDVVYDKCYEELESKNNLESYDLIILTGEARSRTVLTLETQAKNISSCSLKDNLGVIKHDEKINKNGKDILKTNVDTSKLKHIIELSNDAGKFVCNNLYYHLLEKYPEKTIFIHIPECNNDENIYLKHGKIINEIIKILS